MKTGVKILTAINLSLTMIFVAAVDSLSNLDILKYSLMLALLWYSVKCINESETTKNQIRQQQCKEENDTE